MGSNRMLRAQNQNPVKKESGEEDEEDDEIELKKTIIDIFQGLLEGQGKKITIYEKMLSVLHIDVIVYFALGDEGEDRSKLSEGQLELNSECLVLLQMFCDF